MEAKYVTIKDSERRQLLLSTRWRSASHLNTTLPCASLVALTESATDLEGTLFGARGVLERMQAVAAEIPAKFAVLVAGVDAQVTLSKRQVLAVLCNAFFCVFEELGGDMPSINFTYILKQTAQQQKLRALLHYFERATSATNAGAPIRFHRRVLRQFPSWIGCVETPLSKQLTIQSGGRIEECDPTQFLHADFANKVIGGGVLTHGCVQEEIYFLIHPECIAARLFCPTLGDREVLVIQGIELYSSYTGYSETFRWKGNVEDPLKNQRARTLVAFDAIKFKTTAAQFTENMIVRELNKAYSAFFLEQDEVGGKARAMATSSWGCGAFQGQPHLKFLIQWMAASVAGRPCLYMTFDDAVLALELQTLATSLTALQCTVAELFSWMQRFDVKKDGGPDGLFGHIIQRAAGTPEGM